MNMSRLGKRRAKDRWVLPGAAMGVAAGMVFIIFQMVAAVFVGVDFLAPLSTVGNAVLGWGLFGGPYSPEIAPFVGLPVYAVVFAALGAAFGTLSVVGSARRSRGALLVAGTTFGALLWMFDLALISWDTFYPSPAADLMLQLVAHGVFFGTTLAVMLAIRMRVEEPAASRVRVDRDDRTTVFLERHDDNLKGGR